MRSALRELRDVLEEGGLSLGGIETVRGRGYRFIAELQGNDIATPAPALRATPKLVGRERARGQLRDWLAKALIGHRGLGFVTGEAGIGKTSLVETFVRDVEREGILVGRGRCISRHGDREPYRPILEALTELCRQPGGKACLDLLRRHAPTWLVELPGLIEPAEMRRLEASAFRLNQVRMLRELADALAVLCEEQVVLLVLEDLHWSDGATLDALELLARRDETARLLIVGTHRPAGPRDGDGAASRLAEMRAELHLHNLCSDLKLSGLDETEVRIYLQARFPDEEDLDRLTRFVFGRSEGNPLFMVSYADERARTDDDPESLGVPFGLREMVEHQIERLSEQERLALEATSVAGECMQLCLENGFPYYIPAAMIISGSIEVRRGNAPAGIDSIEQGVALFRGVGAELAVPHYLALLGEARGETGNIDDGLQSVREGLTMVERTGEVFGEPELCLAEGHLHMPRAAEAPVGAKTRSSSSETCVRQSKTRTTLRSCERRQHWRPASQAESLGPSSDFFAAVP